MFNALLSLQYTKAIYAYMALAGFSIFFVLVGIIMLQLLVKFQIPLDAFSFSFMLYNFSVHISPMHSPSVVSRVACENGKIV